MVARPQAQQNVARCRDGANVLKSVNVYDLHGFCGDRLVPLFAWTGPSPCSYVSNHTTGGLEVRPLHAHKRAAP